MNRLITAGASLALIATPLVATTASASDATAERQAPAFSVTARINKTTAIAKEDTVKIRGKVTPKAVGEKVVLQQRMEGKKTWSASGTSKVRANGTFVLKDDPSAAGTRFYRVLKPAGRFAKGVSPELELVVYAWQQLGYRTSGPYANVLVTGATIATDYYGASLVSQTPGVPASIEYTLGKKCTKLRATYALTDISESGATGSVALKVDGTVAFASALAVGTVLEDYETTITDAFRIRYELNTVATPKGQVAVGAPEVLCTK